MDRLDSIGIFVAVAEQGGFVAAARKIGVSPASVSRAIAGLEEVFGQLLFNRTTRALSLTEAGQSLLRSGRRLLADYEDLANGLQNAAAPKGLLTVTAPVMFGRLHIMPIVQNLLREHPGLDIQLLLHDRIISLVDEGVDVGLRIGDLPDSSLLASRVGAVRRVLVASPAYLASRGEPQNPKELADHAFISTFGGSSAPSHLTLAGDDAEKIYHFRPRLTVNSVDAALEAVAAGFGIARLFSYQVEEGVRQGRLARILRNFEPPPVPIHLLRPADRRPPVKVTLFVETATAALRAKFDRG
jgi:molybdate transport repressor ModE-like protein